MKMNRVLLLLCLCIVPVCPRLSAQDVVLPQPYGGSQVLKEMLDRELTYPRQLLDQKVRGRVVLGFIVDVRGQVNNLKVLESTDIALSEEAARLMTFIRWEPALHQGQVVEYEHSLAFAFHPAAYKRIVRSRGYDIPPYPYQPIDSSSIIWPKEKLDTQPSPIFPGGCLSIREFIHKNLAYPPAAQKLGLTGTVTICLSIEPSGRPSNIQVIKGIGGGCDEEAQRLVQLIRWVPGQKDGVYVRSQLQISITFALPEGSDYRYFPTHQGTTVQ